MNKERCNKCWHFWDEPSVIALHNNGSCEDKHNDKVSHCHDRHGNCIESYDIILCSSRCEDAHD